MNARLMAPAENPPRFRALDGLRGIAALLVVLLHVEWTNHITGLQFVSNGYLAVDLFFILSGLVISANYANRVVDYGTTLRFIALRFFRLYPLHLALLITFVGLECVKASVKYAFGFAPGHEPFTGGQSLASLVTNLFLVQGLGLLPTPGWNGPSWSISCEFVAYFLFAVVAWTGLTRTRLFLIGGAIATGLAYVSLAVSRDTLNVVYDLGFVRCFAGFFWGMLIYRWSGWVSSRPFKRAQRYEIGVAAAVIVAMATFSGAMILILIPLFILLIALLRSDHGPIASMLHSRPAQYLGRISYSVYMVHALLMICTRMLLKQFAPMAYDSGIQREVVSINPWVGDALVVAVVGSVIILASRTYVLIEEPGRLLGRRLFGHRAPQREAIHEPSHSGVCVSAGPTHLNSTVVG